MKTWSENFSKNQTMKKSYLYDGVGENRRNSLKRIVVFQKSSGKNIKFLSAVHTCTIVHLEINSQKMKKKIP